MTSPQTEADRLLGIATGHIRFQTLAAACRVGLFDKLAQRPRLTAGELAGALRLPAHSLRVLLLGLCSLDLVQRDRRGRYYNTRVAERLLTADSPSSIRPILEWQQEIVYRPMFHFTESVRRGKNVGLQALPGRGSTLYSRLRAVPRLEAVFQAGMRAVSTLGAPMLERVPELRRLKRVVDVGGGDGTNAVLLHRVNPRAEILTWDIPTVTRRARRNLKRLGLLRSIRPLSGDFHKDPFPQGIDGAMFCHLLSIYSPAENIALLKRCRRALKPGGKIVIWGGISRDDGTGPDAAAAASAYFLAVATGRGMIWSWRDYSTWLKAAGFKTVRRRPPSVIVGIN